jgi:hypothetical protein
MPKQPAAPKKSGLVPPDRAVVLARKEANQRVEELKLRLVVLVDRYFEHSVRIIKNWMKDGAKDSAKGRR